jgi:hypothetical protein
MPLINFPQVPLAQGVPDVRRALAGIGVRSGITAPVLQALDLLGVGDIFAPKWQIILADNVTKLEPDSVVSFEYKKEQRVSSHPVEGGSFSSYNKVAVPFDLRILMTCAGGRGKWTKAYFLAMVEAILTGTPKDNLCSIVTPDVVYSNCSMVHYNYKRESRSGVSLLTVEAFFQEVRVPISNLTKITATPAGAQQVSTGSVRSLTPTLNQLAAQATGVVNGMKSATIGKGVQYL